jgi:hypothetical protein
VVDSDIERDEAERVWSEEKAPRTAAARAERERLTVGYEQLVSAIEGVLFRNDPIGLNFVTNTDEYRAEAQTIVVQLPDAAEEAAVHRIVHEEFVRSFGGLASPAEPYREVVAAIWRLWSQSPLSLS